MKEKRNNKSYSVEIKWLKKGENIVDDGEKEEKKLSRKITIRKTDSFVHTWNWNKIKRNETDEKY